MGRLLNKVLGIREPGRMMDKVILTPLPRLDIGDASLMRAYPWFMAIPAPSPVHWLDVTPVESRDEPCAIDSLDVRVRVNGLYAEVTQTLEIQNPNNRDISAAIGITMPDRAVVCGYALDIDGQMIDGVVVEKETARVAFETEQRKGADPGLVEVAKGNVYRTRVYPVPPHGTRTVMLRYVAPLVLAGGRSAILDLPMPAEPLKNRKIQIDVVMIDCEKPLVTGLGNPLMGEAQGVWHVQSEDADLSPSEAVRLGMPALPESFTMLERDDDGTVWFSAFEMMESPANAQASERDADEAEQASAQTAFQTTNAEDDGAPLSALTVLWDASGSRGALDHEEEFELIRTYCSGASLESLRVITFADRVRETRTFARAEDLVGYLRGTRYDGGTNLYALVREIASQPLASAGFAQGSACVLFTDGLDTLSDEPAIFPDGCDVLAVVSGAERDAESLRQACRGLAFDLAVAPRSSAALARVLDPANPNRTLNVSGTGIADLCDAGAGTDGVRAVIGRLVADKTTISLGDDAKSISLRAADAQPGNVLSRAWAARRVAQLSVRADDNAEDLLQLGRRFGVVSPATSLLVLESLDQWLRYDIEPPRTWTSMHDAWEKVTVGKMTHVGEREQKDAHRKRLSREWRSLLEWWKRDYSMRGRVGQQRLQSRTNRPASRETSYCPHCGSPVMRDECFCRFCGGALRENAHVFNGEAYRDRPPTFLPDGPVYQAHSEMRPSASSSSHASGLVAPLADRARDAVSRVSAIRESRSQSSMAEPASFHAPASAPEPMYMRAAIDAQSTGSSAPISASIATDRNSMSNALETDMTDASESVSVNVLPWMPDAPYLKELDEAYSRGIEPARGAYFEQCQKYRMSPSFFLDCAGWFMAKDDREFGLSVLSNLAEMRIEDAALLRVMGWRLREAGDLRQSLIVLRRVCRLRPEDSQSYRDVALVLEELARESLAIGDEDAARAFAEEAGELYRKTALTPWTRRPMAIALFAVEEYNVMRAWADEQAWKRPPELPSLGRDLEGVLDCDLRITLAWDANETDVDIHVTEPSGEEAYFRHRLTYSGGRVSEDITDGFGPELYEIRRAEEGRYAIRAHYYASHQQSIFGPATCTLTVYTDWGRKQQDRTVTTMRLDRAREMVEIGTASYGFAAKQEKLDSQGNPPSQTVNRGMSESDVLEILGEPDEKHATRTEEQWIWMRSGARKLLVHFVGGKVERVVERMSWGDEVVIYQ